MFEGNALVKKVLEFLAMKGESFQKEFISFRIRVENGGDNIVAFGLRKRND